MNGRALAFVIIGLLCRIAGATPAKLDPLNGLKSCQTQADRLLRKWQATQEWQYRLNERGERILWSPGRRLGFWVSVEPQADGTALVSQLDEKGVTHVGWLPGGCQPRVGYQPLPLHRLKNEFSDEDLRAVVGSGEDGVVYIWSPHMPYSVQGLPQLLEAAARAHAQAVILLDPNADLEFAKKAALRAGIHDGVFRRANSVELHMRGAELHYPSYLFFSKGKLVSPLIPGYRHGAILAGFFESYLNRKIETR